jgi:hypothetical protein
MREYHRENIGEKPRKNRENLQNNGAILKLRTNTHSSGNVVYRDLPKRTASFL